jgi:hypothetical protein
MYSAGLQIQLIERAKQALTDVQLLELFNCVFSRRSHRRGSVMDSVDVVGGGHGSRLSAKKKIDPLNYI